MKLTPRYYQANAIQAGIDNIVNNKPAGILYLPTAAGKSVIIAGIASGVEGYVGILQPQKEIIEQNYAKILAMYPHEDIAMYSASVGRKDMGRITCATIGSIINKKEDFAHIKIWLIDECHVVDAHKGMYKEFFDFIGEDARILGFTATPYRKMGNQIHLINRIENPLFKTIIHTTQIDELYGNNPTKEQYLADMKYFKMCKYSKFDVTKIKTIADGSEFDSASVVKHMNDIKFNHSLLEMIIRSLKPKNPVDARKKILVFAESVLEAIGLTKKLNSIGIKSAVVYSKSKHGEDITKKRRGEILQEFQHGDTSVLVNVQALTTGVDIPNIDCIIDGNPTKSLYLHMQKIGRGARLDPNNPNKQCWIIDLVGNIERFGEMKSYYIEKYKNNDSIVYRSKGEMYIMNNKYI